MSEAKDRIWRKGFRIPPPEEIEAMEPVAETIAEFGIVTPPPVGWKSYLIGLWHWEGPVVHDTVFDKTFQEKWLTIRSGVRVPLKNVRQPKVVTS